MKEPCKVMFKEFARSNWKEGTLEAVGHDEFGRVRYHDPSGIKWQIRVKLDPDRIQTLDGEFPDLDIDDGGVISPSPPPTPEPEPVREPTPPPREPTPEPPK